MKVLNVTLRKSAINFLLRIKSKEPSLYDIRIINTHLIRLNDYFEKSVFRKNDLYVNSQTLWQIMQPVGLQLNHNSHNLTPEEILDALGSINNPLVIFKNGDRYGIVTSIISTKGKPLLLIIEVGAGLIGNIEANINKFVTMYPVNDLIRKLKPIKKKDLIYLNNSVEALLNKKPH